MPAGRRGARGPRPGLQPGGPGASLLVFIDSVDLKGRLQRLFPKTAIPSRTLWGSAGLCARPAALVTKQRQQQPPPLTGVFSVPGSCHTISRSPKAKPETRPGRSPGAGVEGSQQRVNGWVTARAGGVPPRGVHGAPRFVPWRGKEAHHCLGPPPRHALCPPDTKGGRLRWRWGAVPTEAGERRADKGRGRPLNTPNDSVRTVLSFPLIYTRGN